MPAVTSGRPPATHLATVGRYAYPSKMVGMPVVHGKKSARGVDIMGCWTSDPGDPQFDVLGPDGDLALVNVADVRFHADAVAQEAYDTADDAIDARAARRKTEQERKAKVGR